MRVFKVAIHTQIARILGSLSWLIRWIGHKLLNGYLETEVEGAGAVTRRSFAPGAAYRVRLSWTTHRPNPSWAAGLQQILPYNQTGMQRRGGTVRRAEYIVLIGLHRMQASVGTPTIFDSMRRLQMAVEEVNGHRCCSLNAYLRPWVERDFNLLLNN